MPCRRGRGDAHAGAAAAAPVHISDEGDRLLSGKLKPEAERRSHANALYAQAMLLLEGVASSDDQQHALQLFRQLVQLDPDFSDAQLKLANLLLQTGQFDEAYRQLAALAKAHPGSVPVEVELGYTQRLRGQNEDAQRICARALGADSTQSVAMRVILEVSRTSRTFPAVCCAWRISSRPAAWTCRPRRGSTSTGSTSSTRAASPTR